MLIENMCSNICQWILKLSFGDVNYFHGSLVDWCHEEIRKPENVKGGMCGSLLIRNGYSLALIKNKSFSILNYWFSVLLELSMPLRSFMKNKALKCSNAMCSYFNLIFSCCVWAQLCAAQECWKAG